MRNRENKNESKWSWSLRFFFFGVCLLLLAGLHYWLAGKFLAPQHRGEIITYWLVGIGGGCAVLGFFIKLFSRTGKSRNSDNPVRWRFKVFLMGLFLLTTTIFVYSTSGGDETRNMLALILLGFGALFVAIPIIFSGKGTGWFSSVREGNFQAPAHAREKLDSVFGANAQNPDPEHSDSGRKLMEGSDRRS